MNLLKSVGALLLWCIISYLYGIYIYSDYYDTVFFLSNILFNIAYVLITFGTVVFIALTIGDGVSSLWYKIKVKYNIYQSKKSRTR